MPDTQRTVHTLNRDNGERLTAQLSEFKGKQYASIRSYYEDRVTHEFKPGKNGLSVAPTELHDVLVCVLKLIETQSDTYREQAAETLALWLDGRMTAAVAQRVGR